MTRRKWMWLWMLALLLFIIYCVWSKVHALSSQADPSVQSVAHIDEKVAPLDVSHELKRKVYTTDDINCKIVKNSDNSIEISGLFASKADLEAIKGEYDKVFDNVTEGNIEYDNKSHNSAITKLLSSISSDLAEFENGSVEYSKDILVIEGEVKDIKAKESITDKAEAVSYLYVDNRAKLYQNTPPVIESKPEPKEKKEQNEPKSQLQESLKVQDAPKTDTHQSNVEAEKKSPVVNEVKQSVVAKAPEVKIISNQEIQDKLNNILKIKKVEFVYATAKLTPSGKRTVDEVFNILDEYLNIDVEIGGHTDSDGRASSNDILSLKRAVSVRDYLISKGIEPSRLKAIGYGESRPLVKNDSLAHKQMNRRVEFKVIGE